MAQLSHSLLDISDIWDIVDMLDILDVADSLDVLAHSGDILFCVDSVMTMSSIW